MAGNYKAHMLQVHPAWMRDTGNGMDAVHAGKGDVKDSLAERIKQAVIAGFALRAPTDALALIGKDRSLPRGLGETDANYALRLQHAWDSWPYAGTAFGLLNALRYAGYNVVLLQGRTYAYSLDVAGNLVITSYPPAYPYWHFDGTPSNWARFDVLFQPSYQAGWRSTGTSQTFAALAGSSSSFGAGNWAFTGTPQSDVRMRFVCTTAGSPGGAARYSVSFDNGLTWTTGLTSAQVVTAVAANGAGVTLSITSNVPASALGDVLYVQSAFTIPADGSTEASFVKSLVALWKPVWMSVHQYIIPTSGRTIGWPVTQLIGVADGSGAVPRIGGASRVTWSP
jgi:hypothetical protein